MSSEIKYFLIFDGIIVLILLLWLFRRDKRPRMRAKIKVGSTSKAQLGAQSSDRAVDISKASGFHTEDRSLTLFFNYNGHSFEAYESLGIPAGSSLETAQAAYEKGSFQIDAESREFLKAALEAIRKSHL